jgi:hypothetical protein
VGKTSAAELGRIPYPSDSLNALRAQRRCSGKTG